MLFIERFFDITQRYPDNTAIQTNGGENLSYTELQNNAEQLALYLRKLGVGQGDLVAIAVPKSAEYITAMLACWMLGGAFMPLDPKLPDERRDYILDDADPTLILDQTIINAAQQRDFEADFSHKDFKAHSLTDVAYVIFTSGSTGKPKGVMVSHNGLVNCLMAQIDMFNVSAKSRSLFYLSTNFDASISDIGTALLSGAALLIETGDSLENAANLPEILTARAVTHMDIPPSLLRLMKPAQMPDSLETIIIGGEVCPPQTVIDWSAQYKLINVYGPTEATICTSMSVCEPDLWSRPLIGRPLPNVEYSLMNDNQDIIQGAGTGELLIGGVQLAIGYLNRPELNAQKFVKLGGKRFYRTGDLITRHANGDLEFLGRTDRQVKINGQLVELEEVETKLSEHDSVARAAVVKRDIAGRSLLTAFIEPKEKSKITADILKFWLGAKLPSWMVPQHIIMLDAMPKTITGKIDYAPLQLHDLHNSEKAVLAAPKNEIEQKILALWQRVLKTAVQTTQQNFFTLGGDSMAVLELSLEAEMQNLPLTTSIIVEFPTIKSQANWLAQNTADFSIEAGGMNAHALSRDIAFDDEWQGIIAAAQALPKPQSNMEHIFYTGGTGFLGARLLYDLLQATKGQFTALVRAQTPSDGMKRLDQAIAKHDLTYSANDKARISILCGDFAQPHLGLEGSQWDSLAKNIDTIFHIGALVNMVAPYQKLRGPNLVGTQEIAKLALSKRRKAVHYASTLSVFVSTDQNTGTVYEADRLEHSTTVYGGYSQSKWAAEKFLLNLPHDLCDLYIYRLGLITADTKLGRSSDHDFLTMFVKGLSSLKALPEGDHSAIELDVTPVDYASKAMAEIARAAEANIYHIANDKGFSLDMIKNALNRRGGSIVDLPISEWRAHIQGDQQTKLTSAEASTCLALCRLFEDGLYSKYRAMDLFQGTNIVFDTSNTDQATAQLKMIRQLCLGELLECYLGAL